MNEHPILFSTPMVQANMDNRKTMTRRTVGLDEINGNPDGWNPYIGDFFIDKKGRVNQKFFNGSYSTHVICPYGQPGDLLWVREAHRKCDDGIYAYKADYTEDILNNQLNKGIWKPSLHMPKSAARIWLQVEGIRVERLNDISEEDAMAEGVSWIRRTSGICFMDYRIGEHIFPFTAKKSFQTLFLSINGKPKPQREFGEKGKIVSYTAIAWDQEDFDINWAKYNGKYRQRRLYVTTNPWVWVVKYKVLSTTGKPQICYKTNEVCKYDCKGLCRESM